MNRIEIRPGACAGKPVFRNTRIPVTVVLEFLAAGESWESILRGYPALTQEDIQAALQYAVSAIEQTDIFPLFAASAP